MQQRVAVLLSTYNGARFLDQQLQSLAAQDYPDFVILARDDGSHDETPGLLRNFAVRHGALVHVLEDERGNLGPAASFSVLMNHVLENTGPLGLAPAYLMFCDQDDVWEPAKLKLQMACMARAEARHPGEPVLVHSDLRVVDESGADLAGSFLAYQGLDAGSNGFANILASNMVTGCTALVNEALARLALPIPSAAVMHDWWLALVAAAWGSIECIPEPLVRYRQHGRNTLGARPWQVRDGGPVAQLQAARHAEVNPHLRDAGLQALAFRNRFADRLSLPQRAACTLAGLMAADGAALLPRLVFRLLRAV